MHPARLAVLTAVFGALSLLSACGSDQPPASAAKQSAAKQEEKSVVSQAVSKAVTEARNEIRDGNITVSSDGNNKPKAEITPKGDFLVDGKPVAINAEQRALLLEYRGHIAGVAESGMEIGMQGADLATKAMGEAFKGFFNGKSEKEIEQSVEAEAAKIKASAAKLCARLPAVMASQQKLAAAVPEFKPYATMTQKDLDDCWDETDDGKGSASKNAAGEAAAVEPKAN